MKINGLNHLIQGYDERRDIAIPGDRAATIQFCIAHFQKLAANAIAKHGYFAVALSGGSTPKAIFEGLTSPENLPKMDWEKFLVFWSDERAVPLDNPDSNYHMAMEAGLIKAPIPVENIFPMETLGDIEANAKAYEQLIKDNVPNQRFDLIMLGMGDDGHTASLFPKTHGLHTTDRLVIANYIPQKTTWRMTFTYDCINEGSNIAIYLMGGNKAPMLKKVLEGPYDPDEYPVQKVGTPSNKALWIVDSDAARELV